MTMWSFSVRMLMDSILFNLSVILYLNRIRTTLLACDHFSPAKMVYSRPWTLVTFFNAVFAPCKNRIHYIHVA